MQSKPNREEALFQQLIAKDIEVYYPWIHVTPVNPRSRKKRPYFPSYLFVKADLDRLGASFLQFCPFAKGLVCFDREPSPVAEPLIVAIRQKVDELNSREADAYAGLERGARLHIHSGLFAGYDAIFDEKLPGCERVRVLLMLINDQQRKVELRIDQVKPA
jgi:transcriptional antiterminator RfaH